MFRIQGNVVQIYRYKLTFQEKQIFHEYTENIIDGETKRQIVDREEVIDRTEFAISENHKELILKQYPDATVEQLDTADIEWIDGLVFNTYEEASQALKKGYYVPKRSPEQLQADIDYIAMMTGVEL